MILKTLPMIHVAKKQYPPPFHFNQNEFDVYQSHHKTLSPTIKPKLWSESQNASGNHLDAGVHFGSLMP